MHERRIIMYCYARIALYMIKSWIIWEVELSQNYYHILLLIKYIVNFGIINKLINYGYQNVQRDNNVIQ